MWEGKSYRFIWKGSSATKRWIVSLHGAGRTGRGFAIAGDYDALTSATMPDAEGRFQVQCSGLSRGKSFKLRLTALQVNGLTYSRWNLPFEVSPQGVVDVEDLRTELVLDPIVAALRVGRSEQARKLTAALPETEPARALAAPMLTPPSQRAARADANAREVSLCDLEPQTATVGWRAPAYDYSPEDLFVRLGGKLQRRCIYAHAPSNYSWQLDGTWKRFQATCAIGNGYDGSVVFVVKTGGVERWRSGLLKAGAQQACDVDISNARTMELIVEDGGDDMHRDHAFWFAPVLKRQRMSR